MNKWFVIDELNGDTDSFDTIEEAKKHAKECIGDGSDGWAQELLDGAVKIAKVLYVSSAVNEIEDVGGDFDFICDCEMAENDSDYHSMKSTIQKQAKIIELLKKSNEYYGNEMNYSIDDYHGISGEMRTNVQEIFKILNLPDVFRRLEMNTEELKPIEHLLTPFLGACQNNSPTLGELIALAKKYDGVLECYIVNTDRNDTRFSCEGIFFPNISRKNLIAIVSKYPDADEMNVDDNNLKLWWD